MKKWNSTCTVARTLNLVVVFDVDYTRVCRSIFRTRVEKNQIFGAQKRSSTNHKNSIVTAADAIILPSHISLSTSKRMYNNDKLQYVASVGSGYQHQKGAKVLLTT